MSAEEDERKVVFVDLNRSLRIIGTAAELKIPYEEIDKIIFHIYGKCIDNKIDCELIRK